ncbi:hypothetical protein HK104_010752 [Borealophlyctis nickersoniae]|nr:hypothetical protein HK104_010752 [Borealophlyctis nickersoniae]
MANNNSEQVSFRPPDAFIQASQARQSKIKQQQYEREIANARDVAEGAHTSPEFLKGGSHNDSSKSPMIGGDAPTLQPNIQPKFANSSLKGPAKLAITSPSKTALQIEALKEKRTERRRKQDEMRRAKEGLSEHDQDMMHYGGIIAEFREDFAKQWDTLAEKVAGSRSYHKNVKIRVCVRKRPLNVREVEQSDFDIVTTKTASFPYAHVYIHEPKTRLDTSKTIRTHRFVFDNVHDHDASNEDVYLSAVKPLVKTMFKSGRVTLFAYGQTGSGKTHTVFGGNGEPGLYEYVCRDVFQRLSTSSADEQLTLQVCFFELYGQNVFDLFSSKSRVQLLEDHHGNVQVFGLREISVSSVEEMLHLVAWGAQSRSMGSTEANPDSSRSHAVFQIRLRGRSGALCGKFSLVDLAGSERGVDRGNVGKQAQFEGAEINKSLLALKECIRALHKRAGGKRGAEGTSLHIPFRGSKLTQILRDSFVGEKARTVMIATISPGSNSAEHSLNTLRYADRVKEFKRGRADMNGVEGDDPDSPDSPVSPGEMEDVASPELDSPADNLGMEQEDVEEEDDEGGGSTEGNSWEEGEDFVANSESGHGILNGESDLTHTGIAKDQHTKHPAAIPTRNMAGSAAVGGFTTSHGSSPSPHSPGAPPLTLSEEGDALIHAHLAYMAANAELARDEKRVVAFAAQEDVDMRWYAEQLESLLERRAKGDGEMRLRLAQFCRRLKAEGAVE